jgi:hypothetical protein
MYRSFRIRSFRGFRELTVEPLERVNLIAGMNNVGKTSLLEALFLHMGPGNPDLTLRVQALRGIEQFAPAPRELWGWLFFSKHLNETIELTGRDEEGITRTLSIRLEEPLQATSGTTVSARARIAAPSNGDALPARPAGLLTTAPSTRELLLEYHDSNGVAGTSRVVVTPEGIRAERAQLPPVPMGAFLSTRIRFPAEDAERFSDLERVGRQDEVIESLRILEPRLKRLSVLVTGGVPMIHGDIGIDELIPIPLMGEGTGRLLSLLLAINAVSPGYVLVDEIENGLHHSILVDAWRAIAKAARQANTQVFAATHSWECIRAAHEAFASSPSYDFRLHRLDRINGDIVAVTYEQETLATSVEMNLEVR